MTVTLLEPFMEVLAGYQKHVCSQHLSSIQCISLLLLLPKVGMLVDGVVRVVDRFGSRETSSERDESGQDNYGPSKVAGNST